MGKRGRILIAAAAIAVLGVVVLAILLAPSSVPEPVYNGKTLTVWLRQLDISSGNNTAFNEALTAVRNIGTNAIPTLLQMLRAHDSPLKRRLLLWNAQHHFIKTTREPAWVENRNASLGFRALGYRAIAALPELVKIFDQKFSPESQRYTVQTLGDMGSEAAVPALSRALASKDESVRSCAIRGLGQIHTAPDAVVPVLISALHDPYAVNRAEAASALGAFRVSAKAAIPELEAMRDHPDTNSTPPARFYGSPTSLTFFLRSAASSALYQIDRGAYAGMLTNRAAGVFR